MARIWWKRKLTYMSLSLVTIVLIRVVHLPNLTIVQTIYECGCSRMYMYPPPLQMNFKLYNSTCSDEGTFYQNFQNVVTFSMHFPNKNDTKRKILYMKGIRQNLEKMKEYYPGYSLRIYTDEILEGEYCDIVCNNKEIFWCDVRKTPSHGDLSDKFYATWRFLTLGDPTVGHFLSRDLDSLITEREVAVVQDWLKLDKPIHLMRDKENQHNLPILAGMWGARNDHLGSNATKLQMQIIQLSGPKKRPKNLDQQILNKIIFFPRKNTIVAYDSYHCKRWSNYTLVRPFPRKRENAVNDFVGNVELGRKKYNLTVCPIECRPDFGKDWEYC